MAEKVEQDDLKILNYRITIILRRYCVLVDCRNPNIYTTSHHDITEILLKVALSSINLYY
jgi:hypothetical protein